MRELLIARSKQVLSRGDGSLIFAKAGQSSSSSRVLRLRK
jgi:hypothetical protein